jgi:hypothetical protein
MFLVLVAAFKCFSVLVGMVNALFGGESEFAALMVGFDHDAVRVDCQAAEMHPAGRGRDIPFIAHSEGMIVNDDGAIVGSARKAPDDQCVYGNDIGCHCG